MSEVTSVAAVRESLAVIVQPLREQLAQVDKDLARAEEEVFALKLVQREITNALKAVDPELAAEREAQWQRRSDGVRNAAKERAKANGGSVQGRNKYASHTTVALVEGFVRDRQAVEFPDGIRAKEIAKALGISASSVMVALEHLRDLGVVRLDRAVGGPKGGKFWKLAKARDAEVSDAV